MYVHMYVPCKAFQKDQAVLPSTDSDIHAFHLLANSIKAYLLHKHVYVQNYYDFYN